MGARHWRLAAAVSQVLTEGDGGLLVWWVRLCVALALCGWLQLSFWRGWCQRQSGFWWADHANLILLYVLPWNWAQELGKIAYVMDYTKHFMLAQGDDPMHRLGDWLHLYDLKYHIGRLFHSDTLQGP